MTKETYRQFVMRLNKNSSELDERLGIPPSLSRPAVSALEFLFFYFLAKNAAENRQRETIEQMTQEASAIYDALEKAIEAKR